MTIFRSSLPTVVAALVFSLAPLTRAAEPKDDRALVDNVNNAVENGKRYLRTSQKGGNWELGPSRFPGGQTALAMLALLSAGEKPSSDVIQKGLKYLRDNKSDMTYVVSLKTMVYAAVADPQDMQRIRDQVDWLLKARRDKDAIKGWGYTDRDSTWVDFSNTQYALLALHEGIQAGVKVEAKDIEWIRELYTAAQVRVPDPNFPMAGWGYQKGHPPTLPMTVAGACGLLITGMDLNVGREKIDGKKVEGCGQYAAQKELDRAVRLVGRELPAEPGGFDGLLKQHLYYTLYGIERLGRLSGQRFLGGKDWYRIGCEFLVGEQRDDGSWVHGDGEENGPTACSAFALLFLSKGRTPVLISKYAHDQNQDGDDWNNDHYDVRNLVEFTRKEIFARPNQPAPPLAWQIFDPRLVKDDDDAAVKRIADELLQTPVVVLTGHEDPHLASSSGLTRNGKILKEYLENGGFVYIEACCGDARFRKQVEEQVTKLFPRGTKLEELDASHPVWSASGKWASYPKDFKLKGVQHGCRTPLIYSEENLLCCQWEINDC